MVADIPRFIVVLHVARADLEDVHVIHHHLNLRRVHHLADGEEAKFVRGFAHKLEARFSHPLEGIRRSTRLESPAAKDLRTGFGNALGDGKNLFTRFDRARSGRNNDFRAADFYAAAKIDDGAFRPELAAGEFEWLGDAHDFAHAVQQFEVAMIEIAVNANRAEHGMRFASRAMNVEAAGDQPVNDMLDLRVRGPFLHHDDHKCSLFSRDFPLITGN